MLRLSLLLLFLFTFLARPEIKAQTTDNVMWASVKVQKKLSQKISFAITPILRLRDDPTEYDNSSIDISIKHTLPKGWHVQFLARTWFMPDRSDRQFLWLDAGHVKKFNKIGINNNLRLHYALDIKDRADADFLRWQLKFSLLTWGKVQPFIAIEPWLGLNGDIEFRRIRYQPGAKIQLQDNMSLVAQYWRQETLNLEPPVNLNMYVVTLGFNLP